MDFLTVQGVTLPVNSRNFSAQRANEFSVLKKLVASRNYKSPIAEMSFLGESPGIDELHQQFPKWGMGSPQGSTAAAGGEQQGKRHWI